MEVLGDKVDAMVAPKSMDDSIDATFARLEAARQELLSMQEAAAKPALEAQG